MNEPEVVRILTFLRGQKKISINLSDRHGRIYIDGVDTGSFGTPFTEPQLCGVVGADVDNGIVICHPDVAPHILKDVGGVYICVPIPFDKEA